LEALDRLSEPFRIKRPQNRLRTARQEMDIHGGGIGQMEHRRDVEIDGILSGQALGERVPRVGHEIAVAQHDSFGAPGGAAGVGPVTAKLCKMAKCEISYGDVRRSVRAISM